MLNYIWLSLLLIGVGVALWSDVKDISTNKYHNGEEWQVAIELTPAPAAPLQQGTAYAGIVALKDEAGNTIRQKMELTAGAGGHGTLRIFPDDKTPPLWREIMKAQRTADQLSARVYWESASTTFFPALVTFDAVKFVKMNSVTNDGIIKYAKTAVELALGLIGIMALWLGIMKIAEQAGLIAQLARALKPLTTRLFPDVPPDHPAMGAMIMNMSANMLGLSNAATPFGLKAMEELNKLSKKAGTATDAMCTFLVINTSSVQLIPATVIAIRASAGSANPTEILGPVIVATTINTIVGVTAVKLLAKLGIFRRQLEEA